MTPGALPPSMHSGHLDRFATVCAPAHWQAVDFISDLHLQASETATAELWQRFLQRPLHERSDALFILGDLFEVWIGDDVLEDDRAPRPFWSQCADGLKRFSRDTPVYFMHGNRDFLVGPQAVEACGMQGLQDPTVLVWRDQRLLLSHGDALCLSDTEYLQFRQQVRAPQWQEAFLNKPLIEREAAALDMRARSEARKRTLGHDPRLWADVDAQAAREWLTSSRTDTLIHGHTHRPGRHDLGEGLQRVVLSDWDAAAHPPRAEVVRLDAQGLHRIPLC